MERTVSKVGRPSELPVKSPADGGEVGGAYKLLRVWKANCVQSWLWAVADTGGVGRGAAIIGGGEDISLLEANNGSEAEKKDWLVSGGVLIGLLIGVNISGALCRLVFLEWCPTKDGGAVGYCGMGVKRSAGLPNIIWSSFEAHPLWIEPASEYDAGEWLPS